ncbi:MAG: hypothetical protein ABIK28_25035, partial [Planctomycetota bacterium]
MVTIKNRARRIAFSTVLICIWFMGTTVDKTWAQTPVPGNAVSPSGGFTKLPTAEMPDPLDPEQGWIPSCSAEFPSIPVICYTKRDLVLLGGEDEETIIFDYTYDKCCTDDLPDMPAHAFRDPMGMVNLLATHYVNIKMIGYDFDSLERDCNVLVYSAHDPYPYNYNDCTWLWSHWIEPGTSIVHSLAHMEYQGHKYPGFCGCSSGYFDCLWGAIVWAASIDGGKHFGCPLPPDNLILTVPYVYEPNVGSWIGTVNPSNIIMKDGYYYLAFAVAGSMKDGTSYKSLRSGWSMMRTDNLNIPSHWRIWDGEGFNMKPIHPYTTVPYHPKDHIPAILSYGTLSTSG